MVPRFTVMAAAGLILAILASPVTARGETVEYDLTIARQEVDITGRSVTGMTVNGGLPGPTLRFREGDTARIRVRNTMSVATSIHWHGVLVPPDMDGVPYVSFPPIVAGATFTYEFPIRQSGTYWYHSHTGLQEQSGVYGSIVIEPLEQGGPKPARDYVLVLSDWTDEDPHEVNRALKRGSEWYAIRKGSGQSILGAARLGMLGDYFTRELQRMPPMDIADVAYDRFLANGKPETTLPAGPGETVRLRIIDGSATTYFHLEFAGGPMTVVSADGQEVEPIGESRFLIGVAETYDVLVQVPASGAYEFRATAHDGSGHASVWIGSGERHPAPDVPRPNLYSGMGHMGRLSLRRIFALTPAGVMGMSDREVESGKFDRPGTMGMGPMGMGAMHGRNHGPGTPRMPKDGMDHPSGMNEPPASPGAPMDHGRGDMARIAPGGHTTEDEHDASRAGKRCGADFRLLAADVSASKPLAVDGMDPRRPWPPYARLRAIKPTAFPKERPVREIRLTLDGDMERYVWFLDNKPLSESDSIRIRGGEVVRFIMINRTMMHHPMHLHGHFFRVVTGQGDHSPLKHTVDVAPMSTTVIEFSADEVGDWFFHCHLLYHMKAGMARVVHYEDFLLDPRLAAVRPTLYKDPWYFWGQADALSNMTEGFFMLSNTRNILTAEWEAGWQDVDDTEWEGIVTWDRYVDRFFSAFAGADVGNAVEEDRGVIGIRYLLPINLETRAFVGTDGGSRIIVGRKFDLTPRIALSGQAQYDADDGWEGRAGLSYTLDKRFSLLGRWHSDYGFGAGLRLRF